MTQSMLRFDREISFAELISALWRGKLFIILVTAFFSVSAVALALYLPNKYQSSVLLAPANSSSGDSLKGVAGQLGGLASLAGISVGGTGISNTALALEIVKSRDFLMRFIEKYELLVPLMAVKRWDAKTQAFVLDETAYLDGVWVRDVSFPRQPKPSLQEAYEEFIDIVSVSKNTETGMVTLGVEHYSPVLAQSVVQNLVVELNQYMKLRDMAEAQLSLKYLQEELTKTQIEEVRQALYQLIEEQTKKLMLTQVTEEYVFKIIDPAIVPERKAKPNRVLICVLGFLMGLFASGFIVLLRYFSSIDPD